MPGTLGKNLHLCFTKIACDSPAAAPLNSPDHDHHSRRSPIFIKNFNSLHNDSNPTSISNSKPLTRTSESDSGAESDSEPDFATVIASQRFFFTSPGRSNSIIESTPSIATTSSAESSDQSSSSNNSFSCVMDSVAVPTDSPDPYTDFRRSMQEMVEARDLVDDVKANWDYLHELLLCYLALNPKNTHKFIISAFADLLTSLMSPPETNKIRRRKNDRSDVAGECKISEQCK